MSRLNRVTPFSAANESGGSPRFRGRLNRRILGTVAATAGMIGGLLATGPLAGATPTFKSYTASATPLPPSSLYVGVSSPVTVTLSNALKSNQPFGSAELTIGGVPQNDVLLGQPPNYQPVVSLSGWNAQFVSTPTSTSAVILLTSLNTASLQPGGSLTVSLMIAPTTPPSFTIGTVVKQSNDFSGTGNNFNRFGADPVIDVAPVTLSFASPAQEPSAVQRYSATAQPGSVIFMCPAVSVFVSANGTPVSGVGVSLSFGGLKDPGLFYAPSPSNVTATSDSSGLATFGSCTSGVGATNIGTGYTLSASSPVASGPVTSSAFSVVQSLQACTPPAGAPPTFSCNSPTLNSPTNGASGSINATFGTPGKLLGSFGQGALTCDNEVTTPAVKADPFDSQAFGTASGVVTITFPKAVVNNLANNGTPLMQVCAGASASFPGSSDLGATVDPEFQGLLQDCPANYLTAGGFELCVISRSKNAANETIQIYASDLSDPHYW